LFGTHDSKVYERYFRNIIPGDMLFLYNYDLGIMRGPFRALTKCEPGLEPHAWSDKREGGFPYQVRIDHSQEFQNPITVDDFHTFIPLFGPKQTPPAILTEQQVDQLLAVFQQRNHDETPITDRGFEEFGYAYIFRCNRDTGAKYFDENIMGAPATLFRSVVSKIQPGDVIFLWVLEECRLYGVWRALSRGQYYPDIIRDSEGRHYPAVVFCERFMNLTNGIDESSLRKLVPYDGKEPPYRIPLTARQPLIQALQAANGVILPETHVAADRPSSEELLTLDGHKVRSRAEVMIDDWLYNRNISHAYDHVVARISGKELRCDFYIRDKDVYIEFWGLVGEPDYERRKREKLNFYRSKGLKLIEIYPKDLPLLDVCLGELLETEA
jgi:hypothetical protein